MFRATEIDLEAGAYRARLKDIEEYEGTKYQSDEPEDKLRFVFEILEEGYEGQTLTRSNVKHTFAPRSTARAIVEGLIGRKAETGDNFEKSDLVGRECDLSISLNETDRGTFANIDRVMPVRKKKRSAEQAESKQVQDVRDGRIPVKEGPPESEKDFKGIPF